MILNNFIKINHKKIQQIKLNPNRKKKQMNSKENPTEVGEDAVSKDDDNKKKDQ